MPLEFYQRMYFAYHLTNNKFKKKQNIARDDIHFVILGTKYIR